MPAARCEKARRGEIHAALFVFNGRHPGLVEEEIQLQV